MILKRITTLLNKHPSQDSVDNGADTPEAIVGRSVRLFCESGSANTGEEVLHLPTIVENAVASPAAAGVAAVQIRKFLSKDGYSKPHVAYNAIMLVRILADNPGQSFTKNVDAKFVDTVKNLLRNGRDPSVQQILRETLDALDREKAYDTNLNNLFAMWRKEQGMGAQNSYNWQNSQTWAGTSFSPPVPGNERTIRPKSKKLPPPDELAARVEEAKTSAKLLLQLVQSTPPSEVLGNDLIKEFSDRCQAAQRSISGYIHAETPAPDDDTMLTLIETNEQLSLALSKQQRAVLQARRAVGTASPPASTTASPPPATNTTSPPILAPVPVSAPLSTATSAYSSNTSALPQSLQAGAQPKAEPQPVSANNAGPEPENPFSDPYESPYTPPPGPPPNSTRPGLASSQQNSYTVHGGSPPQSSSSNHDLYGADSPATRRAGQPVVSPSDERRVSALPGEYGYDATKRTGPGDVSPILEQRELASQAPPRVQPAGQGMYRY